MEEDLNYDIGFVFDFWEIEEFGTNRTFYTPAGVIVNHVSSRDAWEPGSKVTRSKQRWRLLETVQSREIFPSFSPQKRGIFHKN